MKFYTPTGGKRYRNQGTDARIGGMVGVVLAWIQRTFSFHTTRRPTPWIYRRNGWKVGVSWNLWLWVVPLPWFEVFIPHRQVVDKPRWWSFRMGWKFDALWDETPGRGGCFPDVILKPDIDNRAEQENRVPGEPSPQEIARESATRL